MTSRAGPPFPSCVAPLSAAAAPRAVVRGPTRPSRPRWRHDRRNCRRPAAAAAVSGFRPARSPLSRPCQRNRRQRRKASALWRGRWQGLLQRFGDSSLAEAFVRNNAKRRGEREEGAGGGGGGGWWWKDWKWVEQVRYQEKQIIFVRKSVSDDRGSETRRKGKNRGEECGIHVKWAGGYGSGECSKQARERERSLCLRKE